MGSAVGDEAFDGWGEAGVDFDRWSVGGDGDEGSLLAVDVGWWFALVVLLVVGVVVGVLATVFCSAIAAAVSASVCVVGVGVVGVGGWCGVLGDEVVVGFEPFGLVLAWGEGVAVVAVGDGVPFGGGGYVADVPDGSDEGDVAVGVVEDVGCVFECFGVLDVVGCVDGSGVAGVAVPCFVGELVGA